MLFATAGQGWVFLWMAAAGALPSCPTIAASM